jgi:epoxide hydrolase
MNRSKISLALNRHAPGTIVVILTLGVAGVSIADEKVSPPGPGNERIEPFKITVKDAALRDLQDRLARTRWPNQIDGTGWEYGVPVDTMKELLTYWRSKYDWRDQEKKLNQLDQFTTRIDGLDIHFLHVRSKEKNALPLVLVHGWGTSCFDFRKMIGPLTDPVAHGGKAEDAFHVVCPSLPGFAYSSKPEERGWSPERMAEVIAKLMARLGYDRYGAQGGDWGGTVTQWLAANDGAHCIGTHGNMPMGDRPRDNPMRGVTPKELERYEQRQKEWGEHSAYFGVHSTRPLTLGYGLNDSPAALASWLVDKYWVWSDHGGKLDNSFTNDELLTNVMIYWITESVPSSLRIYYESSHKLPRPKSMTPFESKGKPAPLGFASFPKEISVPPRAWVERRWGERLIHWTEMPRGGHWVALEQPQLLV